MRDSLSSLFFNLQPPFPLCSSSLYIESFVDRNSWNLIEYAQDIYEIFCGPIIFTKL